MLKLRHLTTFIFCSTLLAMCAYAQSTLTEIRDTVTNVDGSLFSGTVVITWNGYLNSSGATVSPLSTSARIYTGALSVLLVPSTTASPGAYYQAVYNSEDGTVTWTEIWDVPPSATPLLLSQVRVSTSQGSGGSSGSGSSGGSSGSGSSGGVQYATLPIAIGQVSGLAADLDTINTSLTGLTSTVNGLNSTVTGLSTTVSGNSSSLSNVTTTVNGMGLTVTANATAIAGLTTTVSGLSSTVSGNSSSLATLNTTVTGLGSTVSGLVTTVNTLSAGSTNVVFVDDQTPSGTLDGTNVTFSLPNAPAPTASLELYRNGVLQTAGVDFTLSGTTITFTSTSIPQPSDILQAYYRMPGTGQTATFADNETPGGAINGTNLTFTLAAAPNPAMSLRLSKNGTLLAQNGDYTLNGSTITFVSASITPQPGDSLLASYRH